MRKFKLIVSALLASTMGVVAVSGLTACGDNEQKESVTSVSITNKSSVKSMKVDDSVILKINVNASSEDAKGIDVVSSDATVVKVTKSGSNYKVTALKEGSATITVTSTYDNTKSDSVDIAVVEAGFDPSWIEEGFTYSKTFPIDVIKTFLGAGNYEIISPDSLPGGCYYQVYDADVEEGYPAEVMVVLDGIVYEDYADAMFEAGAKVYSSDSTGGFEAIDATKKYTVSMYSDYDEDTYEDAAPTYLDFYKCSDVWADGTLTDDTAWNEDHYALYDDPETDAELIDLLDDIMANIPFVKMGAEYVIEYIDNSLYRYFGLDYPDEVYVYDYTIDDDRFDGYGTVLTSDGFTKNSDQYGDFYVKNVGYDSYTVYWDFGEGGNTLFITPGLAQLDSFPSEGVNAFIADEIKSIRTLPAYTETTGAKFTFECFEAALDEEGKETMMVADVEADHVKLAQIQAYADKCKNAGYKVDYSPATDESYPAWTMTNGKIVVEIALIQDYDEDTETYSETDGGLSMYIYGDDSAHEAPGIYYNGGDLALGVNADKTIEIEVIDLGDTKPSFVSDHPEIATVDSNGIVHGVAEGSAVITASADYNEQHYEVNINVSVVTKITENIVMNSETFASSAQIAIDKKVLTTTAGTKVSFSTGTNTSKQAPQFVPNANGDTARVYVGNTMTIAAPEGMSVLAVNIVGVGNSGGTLAANGGTLTATTTGYSWEGSASSVTFNCATAKHYRITSLEITIG